MADFTGSDDGEDFGVFYFRVPGDHYLVGLELLRRSSVLAEKGHFNVINMY
jgi:hypothetical protein